MAPSDDKFYEARILKRTDYTPDLWSIRVTAGAPFAYKAGQYATLGVRTPEKHIERAYSIVSSPYENELEFFIELVPQGELTPLLYKLHSGDTMTMRKVPKGRFLLDLKSGRRNHLLLCTVTGIAPFVSYVRTLHRDWKEGKFPGEIRLFMVEGASHSAEFGYKEEVEQVAAQVPWLTYVPTISRPWDEPGWQGETGRVDDLIRKYTDLWNLKPANTSAYLCGHPTMIENGKGILKRCGFQKEQMAEEVYFIPAKEAGA
jgi:ferredoxin--NADP+ reductase